MTLEHNRYEQLCALAGVGQITPDEMSELRSHLSSCASCQAVQKDFLEVSAVWLTPASPTLPEMPISESAMKTKILGRLQESGAQFSKPIKQPIAEPAVIPPAVRSSKFGMRVPIWAVAAMFIVGGILGFGIASRLQVPASAPVVSYRPPAPVVPATTPQPAVQIPASSQQVDRELQQKLAAVDSERVQLRTQMQALQQQIALLEEQRKRDADAVAELKTSVDSNQLAARNAQAELKQLRDSQSAKDADIVAAQYRVRELEDKLKQQDDSERQLMAKGGSELRDLIGARNLHIIDVADVGAGGVKRPFGRVFYTEGKSLIFYAYDLSKTKGNQTFYVWGRREGDPQSNHALGALRNDDSNQQRWVFDFSNTKVLASIDSVYVTLEPNDKPGSQPKGRKLLNAYLGTPANHP